MLKEFFDRSKSRTTGKLASNKITEFHGKFVDSFKFTVPIHPVHLSQLIHPYQGYLTAFPNKDISFQ